MALTDTKKTMTRRLAQCVLIAGLSFGAVPASAETEGDSEVGEGFNLMEEGARMLLRGLATEMEPMLEDLAQEMEPRLRELASEMAPLLEALNGLIVDLDAYHPPEKLPNGDIILRRKTPEDAPKDGEIDL